MSQAELALAKRYMDSRLASNVPAALALVTDDIDFTSERDGRHAGKAAFSAYLAKTPPQGTWEAPAVLDGRVTIKGKVKAIGFIPIGVKAVFGFRGDLISSIAISRG